MRCLIVGSNLDLCLTLNCIILLKMKKLFNRGFPAEFIAEGLDQTRGWFYTLIVLGNALFQEKESFKNVVVNGIVMAEDGKKMSKSLGIILHLKN